jgi:carboxylesterase
VIGFSTGGTLALELAASESVDRLVLIAPFLAIRFSPLVPLPTENWLGLIAHWIPHLPRRSPAVRDRAMRHWAAQQDRFRTFSLRATMSALALIDRVKGLLPAIQAPSLILQGKKDMVVEPAQAQWLFDQLGSKEKKLLWFEDSDHLVALDHERERAIEAVIEFLQTPCEDSPQ